MKDGFLSLDERRAAVFWGGLGTGFEALRNQLDYWQVAIHTFEFLIFRIVIFFAIHPLLERLSQRRRARRS
jgi:hypothetical protein